MAARAKKSAAGANVIRLRGKALPTLAIDSLAAERDEMLLGLLELRTRTEESRQIDTKDAKVG
jgi:hypothetical protein